MARGQTKDFKHDGFRAFAGILLGTRFVKDCDQSAGWVHTYNPVIGAPEVGARNRERWVRGSFSNEKALKPGESFSFHVAPGDNRIVKVTRRGDSKDFKEILVELKK